MHFLQGKKGILSIHNYAIEQSPSHHLYAVERGFVYLKIPMVRRMLFLVKKTRTQGRGKGYGEYTTITAIAGEPTVVAD